MLCEAASDDCVFSGTTGYHQSLLPKATRYMSKPPLTDHGVYASSSAELAMIEAVIRTRGWQWSCTDETTGTFEVSIPRMTTNYFSDGYVNVLARKLFGQKAPLLFYSVANVVPKYAFKLNGLEMNGFLKKRGIKFRVC